MILAADLKQPYSLSLYDLPKPANVTKTDYFMAYRFSFDGKIETVSKVEYELQIPSCERKDFQYWILAPAVSEDVVFLGEMSKVIAVSRTRFRSITYGNSTATVVMKGVPSEKVTLAMVYNKEVETLECVIPSSGSATVTLPRGPKQCA